MYSKVSIIKRSGYNISGDSITAATWKAGINWKTLKINPNKPLHIYTNMQQ
jgi:hypothetical protein